MPNPSLPQLVLLPVEESELVTGVLSALAELSKSWDFELALAHVWEPLPFTPPESSFYDDGELITYQTAAERRAAGMLDRVTEQAVGHGLRVGKRVVRSGHPAFAIVDIANELKADWIAMASHQRHGVSRWFLGSVTERVCSSADVPVLTVPIRPDS